VCTTRWQVEEGFAQAKGEVGLDHYEVRKWEAWHRFAWLPGTKKPRKRGGRFRLDPAHRAGGTPPGARDGRTR